MNKDEILLPILTAINDLREEVRENRRAIQKNSEKIDDNSKAIILLEERMSSIEKRMEKHEKETKKDRKAILDILYLYEKVTNRQYEENKRRIEKLEEKFAIISA